jgi:predicted alpha/beta hydrolase family esterase
MTNGNVRVLTLPGWQNSGPDHWQSLWEREQGFERVEQHDWMHPLRGDWIARLDEVLLADTSGRPTYLAAHSLGCIQVAAWASHSRHTARVQGALLVAPGDVEREDIRPLLPSWQPIATVRLPFPSLLVGSRNDPYCTFERAQALAAQWSTPFHDFGAHGHINSESGLGSWPEGLALLRRLMATT